MSAAPLMPQLPCGRPTAARHDGRGLRCPPLPGSTPGALMAIPVHVLQGPYSLRSALASAPVSDRRVFRTVENIGVGF